MIVYNMIECEITEDYMGYRLIDTDTWSRYETFRHFYDEVPCAVSMCDEIEVTELYKACRNCGFSFYISVLYAVAAVINAHDEFKMKAVDSPEYEFPMPAVYDRVNIAHNIFHESGESYTSVFTVYKNDFEEFSKNCREDIEKAKRSNVQAVPCGENVFEASCVPWRHFTSVGVEAEMYSLLPIVCWGKFRETDGQVMMPLSLQVNHASADGFHIARFINETEKLCGEIARKIANNVI